MRVVQIKLETQDYIKHKAALRRASYYWMGYYTLVLVTLSIEIFEKMHINSNGENDLLKILAIISTFLGLLQYCIFAYY